MKNQDVLCFFVMSFLLGACGGTNIQRAEVPTKTVEAEKKEEKPTDFFHFKGQILLEIVTRNTDDGALPNIFRVNSSRLDQIQYDSDGIAYENMAQSDHDNVRYRWLGRRHRKLTFTIPFESNWPHIEDISNFDLAVDFSATATVNNLDLNSKMRTGDFQIAANGGNSYSIIVSLDDRELCGKYNRGSSLLFVNDCRAGKNLVGTLTLSYSKDKEGNNITEESEKKKITLRFVE